jgi:integrase
MKCQPKRALTLEECRVLLPALATPVREMASLSICTSMNFAEMAGLVWQRVNLTAEAGTADGENLPAYSLAVRQHYFAGEYCSVKSESREHIVPLPMVVVEGLPQIKAASKFTGPDDPVFCNRTGRPHTIANLNKRTLKPTAESLGMGWVSWHAFRRTHATLMDQANAAIADRIAQMGHSAFATTLKYTSADIERRRGSVEQISALVHGTGEREPSENQG